MLAGAIGAGLVAAVVPGAGAVATAPVVVAPALPQPVVVAPPAGVDAAAPAEVAAPATPAASETAPPLTEVVPAPDAQAAAVGPAVDAAPGKAIRDPYRPNDPLVGFNRVSYRISQPIDRYLFRPVAMTYKAVVPAPLRDGARNFLDNLFMSQVLANDILQLRPKRVLHTALRFIINTTLGIGGIFDIAKRKPFHLPAHPNSLGDTLGYYGVHAGPYIYLPVMGPTTLRDLIGSAGDAFTQPLVLNTVTHRQVYQGKRHKHVRESSAWTITTYGVAAFVVGGLDKRVRADDELKALKAQSVDPYAAMRSAFLQDRAGEIAALKAPGNGIPGDAGSQANLPAFDDDLEDPAAAKPAAEKPGATGP